MTSSMKIDNSSSFNYNPVNQDMRISGTCASLAGLEAALEEQAEPLIDHAIKRILLIYGLAMSAGAFRSCI